jgi:O-antigen/teichoic acid export membrane protein
VVVPLTIVLMVLARPILRTWLGPEFGVAATGLTVLVSYWLINANTGVAGSMLVAAGRVRQLAVYAAVVAALNLMLSLALTPSLGLDGVVLGTTLSYVILFPFFLRLTLSTFEVPLRDLAREAWLPAYATGAALAAVLLAVRATVPLDSFPLVAAVSLIALLGYWALYYLVWLRPNERMLVKNVARALVGR